MNVAARRGPGGLRILTGSHEGAHVLTVLGEVGPDAVNGLLATLAQAMATPGCATVIVDLQAVAGASSHALTALVEARGEARSRGRTLRVVLDSHQVASLPWWTTASGRTELPVDSAQDYWAGPASTD